MRHSDEVNDFLKPRIRLLEGLSDPIRRRPSYVYDLDWIPSRNDDIKLVDTHHVR